MATMPIYTLPPSPEDIADLADRALVAIPAKLRARVRAVSILIEEVADDETLAELGIENAWELTGLYRGVPFGHADSGATPHAPDMILLYREPILLEWIETGEDLFRLVRTVLIHEIAHHFGFSDDDIATLESED
jgi:predicted Zn-dependent protease with MMP-like domain